MQQYTADHSPDRVSPLIKEDILYGQRVRRRHRGKFPSSSGQLPVPVALNALSPTLFESIIQHLGQKVNRIFYNCFFSWSKLLFIVPFSAAGALPSPGEKVDREAGRMWNAGDKLHCCIGIRLTEGSPIRRPDRSTML